MTSASRFQALKLFLVSFTVAMFFMASNGLADMHMAKFSGPKANKGTVAFTKEGSNMVLTLSDDFVVPDTPDPHWQVIDSKGNTYLLKRLKIKGDKYNKSITLPAYIKDVSKVQIWCAFAETNLGEASFKKPMK
jgi:hypothetical protein